MNSLYNSFYDCDRSAPGTQKCLSRRSSLANLIQGPGISAASTIDCVDFLKNALTITDRSFIFSFPS